jgi:hypothetical protein
VIQPLPPRTPSPRLKKKSKVLANRQMTRARAYAPQHEVNSLVSTYDFDNPLVGMLHEYRYQPEDFHPLDQGIRNRKDEHGASHSTRFSQAVVGAAKSASTEAHAMSSQLSLTR